MEYFLSRFAFVFIIFAVLVGGLINEILSCQMQKFIRENKYFRHVLAILIIFVFIMLEGGWSLNPGYDKLGDGIVDWSSGNIIDTLLIAIGVYFIFIISAKSQLVPNLIFYGLLFFIYILNAHVNFLYEHKEIDEDKKNKILYFSKILFAISIVILIYGFIDYVIYQKQQYGRKFQWDKFILGTSKCAHVKYL